MDESWKLRMGMQTTTTTPPNLLHRKSTDDEPTFYTNSQTLTPDEFNDVFGGPPKTVLRRQFSSGGAFSRSSSSTSFYEEVFRCRQENVGPAKSGRCLSEFSIPSSGKNRRGEEFYSDIFRSESSVRTERSRSTTTKSSSSVLSAEELSPLRPVIGEKDDFLFSSFASKLRPINVPYRWNSSTNGMPVLPFNHPSSSYMEKQYNENYRNSHFGFSRRVPSPETIISPQPNNSHGSFKVSVQDVQLNSPSSLVSSLCQDQEIKTGIVQEKQLPEQGEEQDEDEVMSSYVIEINSDHREGTDEALCIDEVIAWAKENFQAHNSQKDWNTSEHQKEQQVEIQERPIAQQTSDDQTDSYGSTPSPADYEPNK